MSSIDLNGWNGRRLDDLAQDVHDIKLSLATKASADDVRKIQITLEQMQGEKVKSLEDRIKAMSDKESERTSRLRYAFYGAVPPIIIAIFTVLITNHVI